MNDLQAYNNWLKNSGELDIVRTYGNVTVLAIPNNNYRPQTAVDLSEGTMQLVVDDIEIGNYSYPIIEKILKVAEELDVNENFSLVISGLARTISQRF